MKIELELEKRAFVKLADVTGTIEIKTLGGEMTEVGLKDKLIEGFKSYGLTGRVTVNGEVLEL